MNIRALFVVILISYANGQDRKLKSELNPNCVDCTERETLIYIKAVGSKDTVHQLWDFTQGIPTIIFAIGSMNSSISVSWKDRKVSSFEKSDGIRYSFAVAIDKLFEYNDVKDKGYIEPECEQRSFSLGAARWRRNASRLADDEARLTVRGWLRGRRGSVDVKLNLLPYQDYAADLPHLIHTANSSLVDISLVNLTTTGDYNASRFALHAMLVSTDVSSETMHLAVRKSLDDEHTPGVFEIIEIRTPESFAADDGGFIQFRPVGYTQRERGVAASTLAHVSQFNRSLIPSFSTLKTFYDSYDSNFLLVQDMFVSFGEAGDGYYRQHNYTAWSFTIGYGVPPVEGFSLFVVLVLSFGLGVPVVLALSGIVYVVLRRYRQRGSRARLIDNE